MPTADSSPPASVPENTSTALQQENAVELGPFVVHDLIGKGNTGHVFRAHHSELQHPVALKILPPPRNQAGEKQPWSADRITIFSKELESATRVMHSNVARPTYAGAYNDVRYVAMEWVDGISLQTIAEREQQLEPEIACEIVRQAAAGLRHVHQNGLVHRDIRPANILLTREGLIKITDLGIGPLRTINAQQPNGESAYLAPEQLALGTADIRADIYGLGCTLYRLLSGKDANTDADRGHDPQPIDELVDGIPLELANVVQRMLARNPHDRFQLPNEIVLAMCPWATDTELTSLAQWHAEYDTNRTGLQRPALPHTVVDPKDRFQVRKSDPSHNLPQTRAQTRRPEKKHDKRFRKRELARAISFGAIVFCAPILGAIALYLFQSGGSTALQAPLMLHRVNENRETLPTDSYHLKLLLDLESNHGLPAGRWVLPPNEVTPTNNAVHYGLKITHSDVVGQAFNQAIQLDVADTGEAVWDSGYFVPQVSGLRAGDRVLVAIWLRTAHVSVEGQTEGKLAIYVENETTDEKDVYLAIKPSDTWRQYFIPFESKSDASRRIGFHLAFHQQAVEYGGLAVINYGTSLPFAELPFRTQH